MTDDLVKRWDEYVESMGCVMGEVEHMSQQMRDRIEQLEAENHLLKTSGIIEVAVRNPSVMEYIQHWEGRAEEAESKLAKAVEGLDDLMMHEPDYPDTIWEKARATLAEIKGESHE